MTSILYENGSYWVSGTSKGGYEVLRNTSTHSVVCANIGYKGQQGFERAKAECDKRAAAEKN